MSDQNSEIFYPKTYQIDGFLNAKSFIVGLFGSFAFAAVITLQGNCSEIPFVVLKLFWNGEIDRHGRGKSRLYPVISGYSFCGLFLDGNRYAYNREGYFLNLKNLDFERFQRSHY